MYQAAILSESGFQVTVCYIDDLGYTACRLPADVERRILAQARESKLHGAMQCAFGFRAAKHFATRKLHVASR